MKKTGYFYDDRSFRLNVLRTTRNNGQDTLQDLNYYYDAVGNIVGEADHAQQIFYFANQEVEPVCNYTYDPLYRLLTATGREMAALQMPTHEDFTNNIPCPNPGPNAMQNYTQNYSYDALGNMLQMQSVGNWTRNYEYNNPLSNNYLLGHGGGTVYTYDAHGNMLTMPHLTSMSWDYLDQLHSASNGTSTSYYNYDAEGNRTRKVVVKNNIREERYYIGGYEVFRKYINDTLDYERKTINISDDEKVFVRIEQKTGENPVIRYQYDNHLGSACLELDEIASIISYEEYHPFGTTSYRSGRSETEVSLKRYKYCRKERDEETGLYYYGMRYYAAWICRFVSVDPLQFKYPYYTPYQYAGNKPVSYIDLDGEEEKEPEEFKGFESFCGKGTQENPINLPTVEVACGDGGYMPYLNKFGYNNDLRIVNYIAAVDNVGIDILNFAPGVWNSIVSNYHSIKRGTWIQDTKNEVQGIWNNIKTWVVNEYNYTLQTPIEKQFIDALKNLTSPEFVEFSLPLVIGGASNFTKGSTFSEMTTTQMTTTITKTETSLIERNRTTGNLFRDELAEGLRAEGRTVKTEVYKRTPFGKRYMDLEVWHNGVNLGGIETKVGGSRYLPSQKIKDAWLKANDYPVILVRKPKNW